MGCIRTATCTRDPDALPDTAGTGFRARGRRIAPARAGQLATTNSGCLGWLAALLAPAVHPGLAWTASGKVRALGVAGGDLEAISDEVDARPLGGAGTIAGVRKRAVDAIAGRDADCGSGAGLTPAGFASSPSTTTTPGR